MIIALRTLTFCYSVALFGPCEGQRQVWVFSKQRNVAIVTEHLYTELIFQFVWTENFVYQRCCALLDSACSSTTCTLLRDAQLFLPISEHDSPWALWASIVSIFLEVSFYFGGILVEWGLLILLNLAAHIKVWLMVSLQKPFTFVYIATEINDSHSDVVLSKRFKICCNHKRVTCAMHATIEIFALCGYARKQELFQDFLTNNIKLNQKHWNNNIWKIWQAFVAHSTVCGRSVDKLKRAWGENNTGLVDRCDVQDEEYQEAICSESKHSWTLEAVVSTRKRSVCRKGSYLLTSINETQKFSTLCTCTNYRIVAHEVQYIG